MDGMLCVWRPFVVVPVIAGSFRPCSSTAPTRIRRITRVCPRCWSVRSRGTQKSVSCCWRTEQIRIWRTIWAERRCGPPVRRGTRMLSSCCSSGAAESIAWIPRVARC
uniref:Putative secreted protein n=1 Tax=Anopheles darlingi TaxID=43151 RepID=A0A2M4DL59_ANODA